MLSDADYFFDEMQPSTSGLTLSHMNNKSSVLCPETQDITSQYLVLQQLDAHQKMVSRAKGCVDTTAPKSMQSFRGVSSQKKKRLLKQVNESQIASQTNYEEHKSLSSSQLNVYHSEEDENESTNASFVNKAIQAGNPISNFTCKTAEKISWYLEALSLGELQSQYFSFLDGSFSDSRNFGSRNFPSMRGKKRIVKGDIMDWHRTHFVKPKTPFSPRILADTTAQSKIKTMRCYNPPFRKKKASSLHSSDTFESYDEEDNEEEISQSNKVLKSSDRSLIDEETLIGKISPEETAVYDSTVPLIPSYRRNYNNYHDHSALSKSEEDKYLDFLSKVTEDILRSGVYSDKAIQQAFEFHLQFYKDDTNKEKLQSLLEQVLEGLKVTDEENFHSRNSFLFSHSIPSTPPEKESSSSIFMNETGRIALDINPAISVSAGSANNVNLDNS